MSNMYVYMYVGMHVCTKSFLKPQQIPLVFAHTWRIKLILILVYEWMCSVGLRDSTSITG